MFEPSPATRRVLAAIMNAEPKQYVYTDMAGNTLKQNPEFLNHAVGAKSISLNTPLRDVPEIVQQFRMDSYVRFQTYFTSRYKLVLCFTIANDQVYLFAYAIDALDKCFET